MATGSRCCRCFKTGVCRRCSCVVAGKCINCYPSTKGCCYNTKSLIFGSDSSSSEGENKETLPCGHLLSDTSTTPLLSLDDPQVQATTLAYPMAKPISSSNFCWGNFEGTEMQKTFESIYRTGSKNSSLQVQAE